MRDPFGAIEPGAPVEAVPQEELERRRRGGRGLGACLRQLREDAGVSLVRMAKRAGMTAERLSAVELGHERPDAEQLRAMADGLPDQPWVLLFDLWDAEAPNAELRMTVAEARQMVKRRLREGVTCPCCGRPAKEWRRSLSAGMVRFLRHLARESSGEWHDPTPWVKHNNWGGDYAKVTYWGLARRQGGKEPRWMPTPKGLQFLRGEIKVRKIAVVWRGAVDRFDGPLVTVADIAGDPDPPVHPERGDPPPQLPGIGL